MQKSTLATLTRTKGQTFYDMLFNFLTEHLDGERTPELFPINFSEEYYNELIDSQKSILPSLNNSDKNEIVRIQLKSLAEMINARLSLCYGLKVVKNIYPKQRHDKWILVFYEPLIGYTAE